MYICIQYYYTIYTCAANLNYYNNLLNLHDLINYAIEEEECTHTHTNKLLLFLFFSNKLIVMKNKTKMKQN